MRFIFLIFLLVISSGFVFSDAFADDTEVTVVPVQGSGAPGCENTSQGCFTPSVVTIDVGGKIIFSNTDSAAHTFTAGTQVDGPTGEFDTSMVMAGNSYEWTANVVGEIPYFCMVHPWMTGVIIVQEAETLPPSISVQSDKSSYKEGDYIKISGKVTNQISGKSVTLVVVSPSGDIVSIAQVSPDSNGNYSTSMLAGGAMSVSGNYEIRAQYDSAKTTRSFYFSVSTPSYPSSAPYGTDVTIPRDTGSPGCENSNSCYSPYKITIDEGETVSWYNADSAAHTVTSGTPGNGSTGEFDSSMLMAGKSFSHKFNNSGTYGYFCMVHPWMTGIVSVSESYTSPPSDDNVSQGMKITAIADKGSNTIMVKGQTISDITDVTFRVTSPSGTYVVAIGQISSVNGNFDLELKIGQMWSEDGFYTITAMQSVQQNSLYTLSVEVEVINGMVVENTSVTESNLETETFSPIKDTFPPIKDTSSSSLPVPSGTNIVIPSGTGSPGCENSNSCYEPRTFIAGKGSTITWFNADSAAHTVTSGTPGKGPDGEFDSSLFMSGSSFSHKFVDDGTYNYFCMVHPWMEGKVSITRSGTIYGAPTTPVPTPSPTPTPIPTTPGTISVSVDDFQYSPSDLVTVKLFASKSTTVAVSVIGPGGDSVVSRSVTTDSRGSGSLQFKLPESSQNGTYRIDSTATISGSKVSDSTSFTVKSTSVRVSIVSLQPTDQQGNTVSSFTKGKLGFAKIVLSSDSSVSSLVTINLFDSDLTSLGIGSFKTTLSSGQSEMTLSFFIPNDASFGSGDIYANVFSDWPSQGGVPLTGESTTQVRIK